MTWQYTEKDLLNSEMTFDFTELKDDVEDMLNGDILSRSFTRFDGGNTHTMQSESSMRLHITNIPFSFTENHLKDLLKPFGKVLNAEIIANHRGSKGFGFVTMLKETDALQAKMSLNGMNIGGREIEINYATPRKFTSKNNENQVQPSPSSSVLLYLNNNMTPQSPHY